MPNKKSPMLVLDIETDGRDPSTANLKWFGAYSFADDEYYIFRRKDQREINNLIKRHKYIIGFNNKHFDNPIIQKMFPNQDLFKYKIVLDLYKCLAPEGPGDNRKYKGRLPYMGIKLDNYKLDTIAKYLGIDEKGEIDYSIFKKDKWNKEEQKKIKKYLKKDVKITKELFEWYWKQFKPLEKFLDDEGVRKMKHLRSSVASLAYQIICNKANIDLEWANEKPENPKTYSGGHHLESRWDLVRGNIIEIDFNSAYPHAMMMGNLYSPDKKGWSGEDYFKVEGTYNNKERGDVEKAIEEIYRERLKAKKENNKQKDKSYKLVINSAYGLTGNWKFKSLYNPTAAGDCTSMVRTMMKKLAKTLDVNGFTPLYGFTDSIYVKVPEESNKKELLFMVDEFIDEVKQHVPFPIDTFGMDVEEEIKMIWFVEKNQYLFVTKDNEVEYTSTLLNKNTPKVVMKVFEDYMKPKIIDSLDVKFTKLELKKQLKKLIEEDYKIAAEEYEVKNKSEYKVDTSLQYQIADRYGEGKHFLIPNSENVGVGKNISYCSYEEFKENDLTVEDIDYEKLMKYLKPFRKRVQKKLNGFCKNEK